MLPLSGTLPVTCRKHSQDAQSLSRAADAAPIDYPKPDGVITFDKLSSVFLSNTNHEEDQPSHLRLRDDTLPVSFNLPEYDEPAQRYCPAGVYEIVEEGGAAVYYIGETQVANAETLIYTIDVTPINESSRFSATYKKQFYTD